MVTDSELTKVEAEFVSYVTTCLNGKAIRIQKQWDTLTGHEMAILNQPLKNNDSKSFEEKIGRIPIDNVSFEEKTVNKLLILNAMNALTKKEKIIIFELYWNNKKIVELSEELNISTRAIHKSKYNALKKMKKQIRL